MTTNPRIPFQLSSDRPKYTAPGGKPLIVQVVLNVENWRFDQPMPRKLITAPHGAEAVPDIPNFCWAEYGMRAGLPRILKALSDRAIPFGCTLNAGVIETYPAVAEALLKTGCEFIGHGLHQKSVQAEGSEAAVIAEALDRLRAFSGRAVEGWLGPGLKETPDTVDILKSQGLRYCSDWVLDDLPTWMTTRHGPLISVPYSLEINDSICHAVYQLPSDELLRRLVYTLETFESELADGPRIVTLGLHPHLMGVPHRFGFLVKMLDLLLARQDVVFLTGRDIADWFEQVSPPPGAGKGK